MTRILSFTVPSIENLFITSEGEAINFRMLFPIFHFISVIVKQRMRLMQYSDCEILP